MAFRITGLSPEPFRRLFGLPDDELARLGVKRYVADKPQAFPCRVEMRDAEPGETVLLLNHVCQPADTPYRASHAIFVREGAAAAYDQVDEVPAVMRARLLSLARLRRQRHDDRRRRRRGRRRRAAHRSAVG